MKKLLINKLVDLPTSVGLKYFWCVGFLLRFFMLFQVLTGVFLSLFYSSLIKFGFLAWADERVSCWLIRYLHIWGVSVIFVLLYIHICRGLYYRSYKKISVWNTGFILYLLIMIEAFIGYILPWHQMSYWAATVLTSIILRIPFFGSFVYRYIVGGFSVTIDETLLRFFPIHIILGVALLGLILVHLFYLHLIGSRSPLFINKRYSDRIYFHKYYSIKDLYSFLWVLLVLLCFMLYDPNLVLDCEAFSEAKSLVTPSKIKPEWYFLGYYAILRSVSSKLGGLVLVLVILTLVWVPAFNIRCIYSIFRQVLYWIIVVLRMGLGYMGSCHVEYPYTVISQLWRIILLCALVIYKVFWVIPLKTYKNK